MNLATLNVDGGGPLVERLRQLRAAALAARTAADEAKARQSEAMRQRNRLKRDLVEAHAEGVGSAIKKATRAIAEHDRKVDEDAARAEGLALAAERREADVRRFIGTELDGLLAEHSITAEAARHRLIAALQGLQEAVADWTEAARTTSDLVAAAGRSMDLRAATLPPAVTNLSREASRIHPFTIPAPVPAGQAASVTLYVPPAIPSTEDTVPVGRAVFPQA